MTLSEDQAAEALRQIHVAGVRSRQRWAYRAAAPHLFLWGLLWLIGYGATAYWPQDGSAIWAAIVAGWALAALLVLPRLPRAGTRNGEEAIRKLRRVVASLAVGVLLVIATAVIMHPRGPEMGAYVPLVVAVTYLGAGIWGAGPRYAALGAALFIVTLGAYLLLPAYFLWILAVGGFGTFTVTGLWLRSA